MNVASQSSSQTQSLKFEENLNDNFCIFENNLIDAEDFGRFTLIALKDIEEESLMGIFLIGLSPPGEDATNTNSIFMLDIIRLNGVDYLVSAIKKASKENTYELKVIKKQEHEVKVYSPFSKIRDKSKIDKHLEKLIYDNYKGDPDNFKDILEIAKKVFSFGLNLSLVRNINNFDTENIIFAEDGGIEVGFYH